MGYLYGSNNEQDLRGEIIYRKRHLKRRAAQLEKYRRCKYVCASELDNIQKVRL
jgi:hypothetical protein